MKRLVLLASFLVIAVPASAAVPTRIAPFQDAWPIWSPDGTRIAFTRISAPWNLMQLKVVDVRTHEITQIAQNSFQLSPSWSPDGTKLAYQRGRDVYVSDLHGGTRRVGKGMQPAYGDAIARVGPKAELIVGGVTWTQGALFPVWSPDRKSIAFTRDDGIYVVDGPGDERPLATVANPTRAAWSPDGAQVAFAAGNAVWVASRGLVPPRALARNKLDAGTPSWAPDGGSVVYTWRGGMTRTYLNGRSVLLHDGAGMGAAFSPSGAIAWAGPRPVCPAHISILVQGPIAGSCDVSGTPGPDVIWGSPREGDVILAGGGNDRIHANDGHTDTVNCGTGRDTVWADRTDRLSSCEVIHH